VFDRHEHALINPRNLSSKYLYLSPFLSASIGSVEKPGQTGNTATAFVSARKALNWGYTNNSAHCATAFQRNANETWPPSRMGKGKTTKQRRSDRNTKNLAFSLNLKEFTKN
jgi:hypothetical protein